MARLTGTKAKRKKSIYIRQKAKRRKRHLNPFKRIFQALNLRLRYVYLTSNGNGGFRMGKTLRRGENPRGGYRASKVWGWQAGKWKICPHYRSSRWHGGQIYLASFVLARPRISFSRRILHCSRLPISMEHAVEAPGWHRIWSQFLDKSPTFVSHFWPYTCGIWMVFSGAVNSFVFHPVASSIVVCVCGHVNALPRPHTPPPPIVSIVVVVLVEHFFLSPLCMPHSVFLPSALLFFQTNWVST